MAYDKRKKIYDDDATMIEEVEVTPRRNSSISVSIDKEDGKKTVKVADILETFAGYLPQKANFMKSDGGKCILCGKSTSSSMRKVCFDCLQSKSEELYNGAKEALDRRETTFEI